MGDTRNTACLGYRVWVYPCQFLAGFRRQRLDRIVVKLAFDMDIFQAVYLVGDDLLAADVALYLINISAASMISSFRETGTLSSSVRNAGTSSAIFSKVI